MKKRGMKNWEEGGCDDDIEGGGTKAGDTGEAEINAVSRLQQLCRSLKVNSSSKSTGGG
jgi:hypothetical protein